MSVLDGYLALPADGEIVNTRLTYGTRGFGFDYYPYYDAALEHFDRQVVTRQLPVSQAPRALSSFIARSYFEDYYDRVHIIPRQIDLGNVVSTQVVVVDVWNAWATPVIITGIAGGGSGIAISGPLAFPITLGGISYESWDISVTPTGSPTVDIVYTWTITDLPSVSISVKANRVVAWSISPNWKDGVRETIGFLTDILTSQSGAEQRRALRIAPRRTFRARSLVDGRERATLDNALHSWGARVWAVPVWWDVQLLAAQLDAGSTTVPCGTAYRDFVAGGLALLRGPLSYRYEVVEIDALDGASLTLLRPTLRTWPAGSRLYPIRLARLKTQPRIKRFHDQGWSIDYEFVTQEPSDYATAAFPVTYLGRPVFEARPDETEDLTITYARLVGILDNDVAAPHVFDTAAAGFALQAHRWVTDGAQERDELRRILYSLRGRQVSVWVPTHADDLRLVATITSASISMLVEHTGYTRFALDEVGRRDVRIELFDGTVFYRRIVGASEVDEDVEDLSMNAVLGVNVTPAQVRRISFMRLMRADDDDTEIRHETDVMGVAQAEITLRTVRDDI